MSVRRKKGMRFLLLLLCMAVVTAAGCGKEQEDGLSLLDKGQEDILSLPDKEEQETVLTGEETGMIYIYVCGAVCCPGVYQLPENARIYEAIDAAGGLREDASGESVNQAQKLEDGQRLYVPTVDETQQDGVLWGTDVPKAGEKEDGLGKVNINSATAEELKTLPGIGDAKAQSIVSYRQQNGAFQSIEELMNVEGIKSGVFDKIKDKITV